MEKSHLILIKLQCHKQGLCNATFIHSHKVIKYILMHKVLHTQELHIVKDVMKLFSFIM
jgi:hypothetical protein